MASEMVERVALAITGSEQRGGKLTLDDARKYARAAIEAMREPSLEMMSGLGRHRFDHPNSGLMNCYHAMIDAALQDGEG